MNRVQRRARRAIAHAGALGGLKLDTINEILESVGLDEVKDNSYRMHMNSYVPIYEKHPTLLGENIMRAMNVSTIRQAARDRDISDE